MIILWSSLAGILLYLEMIYHFFGYGWCGHQVVYAVALIAAWTGIVTLLVGVVKGRAKKIVYYSFIWFMILWGCVQQVYLHIFKQPLSWELIFRGGGDALTNYWREALTGIVQSLPAIVLMVLPGVAVGIIFHKKKWKFPQLGRMQVIWTSVVAVAGIVVEIVTMQVGKYCEWDYYEEYTEFYDPYSVAESMGFLPLLQRDTQMGLWELLQGMFDGGNGKNDSRKENSTENVLEDEGTGTSDEEIVAVGNMDSEDVNTGEEGDENPETEEIPEEEVFVPTPHQFSIDYVKLHELADNKQQTWLADYIESEVPTNTNEYTGIFEGYNLIYLTAEGFSTYAVREDLTPTLYRLVNSGFVFENYYVPLWQTSTSDGEYINCTGLIPDGQFSMRKSGDNDMAFSLPRFFETEGVKSYAYHNNSLSYYDRHITHPNLGYDFKSCKLGNLSESEWGDKIFPMENPGKWPASDWEMMQGTLPEYLQQERFHVYYMTVSGHMNYNFRGNAMAYKNKDAVAELEMSETAQAYIACHIEVDKALEYLLAQLEEAGQLENTVICLTADHYPYAVTEEEYEELAGKSLTQGMDKFRNSLILWNAGMEDEPVYVDKVCGSMDVLPTLLNLFGFEYDSRMYAGRDIFSDVEGMVIFNDRSFVTDSVIYNKKAKETIWVKDEQGNDIIADDLKDAYFEEMKQEVKDRYKFSAGILQEDYYADIKEATIKEAGE